MKAVPFVGSIDFVFDNFPDLSLILLIPFCIAVHLKHH